MIQFVLSFLVFLYQTAWFSDIYDKRVLARADYTGAQFRTLASPATDEALQDIIANWPEFAIKDRSAITVYSPGGEVVASSVSPPIPWELAAGALTSGTGVRSTELDLDLSAVGAHARVAARNVLGSAGIPCVIAVAIADDSFDHMTANTRRVMVISMLIGLVAAGAAAWFISGIAVRPIRTIRKLMGILRPDTIARPLLLDADLPEVRSVLEELESTRQRIDQAFAAQERFVANLSHELKTPIATVFVEAQVAEMSNDPDELRAAVRSAGQEMARLGRMVDSFVHLTRACAGRADVRLRVLNLFEIATDAVAGCRAAASEARITVALHAGDIDEQLAIKVAGDAGLLSTMLDYLIRNAIRQSQPGTVVRIDVNSSDASVCVRVADTGPHIPERELPRLFDRFVRSVSEPEASRLRVLGLQIAQGVAELHRGRIKAENLASGGCAFTVELPRIPASQADTAALPAPRVTQWSGPSGV